MVPMVIGVPAAKLWQHIEMLASLIRRAAVCQRLMARDDWKQRGSGAWRSTSCGPKSSRIRARRRRRTAQSWAVWASRGCKITELQNERAGVAGVTADETAEIDARPGQAKFKMKLGFGFDAEQMMPSESQCAQLAKGVLPRAVLLSHRAAVAAANQGTALLCAPAKARVAGDGGARDENDVDRGIALLCAPTKAWVAGEGGARDKDDGDQGAALCCAPTKAWVAGKGGARAKEFAKDELKEMGVLMLDGVFEENFAKHVEPLSVESGGRAGLTAVGSIGSIENFLFGRQTELRHGFFFVHAAVSYRCECVRTSASVYVEKAEIEFFSGSEAGLDQDQSDDDESEDEEIREVARAQLMPLLPGLTIGQLDAAIDEIMLLGTEAELPSLLQRWSSVPRVQF